MSDEVEFGVPDQEEVDELNSASDQARMLEDLLADRLNRGQAISYGDLILVRAHTYRNLLKIYRDGEQIETINLARTPSLRALGALLDGYNGSLAVEKNGELPEDVGRMFR